MEDVGDPVAPHAIRAARRPPGPDPRGEVVLTIQRGLGGGVAFEVRRELRPLDPPRRGRDGAHGLLDGGADEGLGCAEPPILANVPAPSSSAGWLKRRRWLQLLPANVERNAVARRSVEPVRGLDDERRATVLRHLGAVLGQCDRDCLCAHHSTVLLLRRRSDAVCTLTRWPMLPIVIPSAPAAASTKSS